MKPECHYCERFPCMVAHMEDTFCPRLEVDITVFFRKFDSEATQIRSWSKKDPFNAFIMGFLTGIKEASKEAEE